MITTGNKLLIGATVLTTIAAIAYGVTQEGALGTVGLSTAAVALAFLTAMNLSLRDSNVSTDPAEAASAAAAIPAPGRSGWPSLLALGGVTIVVGLVSYQAIFIIGLVAVLAAGAQWTIQAWSEGASADRIHNAEVRGRVANSYEFPLLGAIGIGIIVYAFSRIMLWLSKTNTVVAFSVVAGVVLIFAFLSALRPSIKSGVVGTLAGLVAIGIVAGGAAAGVDGERDIHVHETAGELALEGLCENPEETEADENASQTVANTANLAARVTLDDDGLTATVVGSNGDPVDPVVFPRSNPSNILFTNRTSEPRRLSLDLGPAEVTEDAGGEGGAERFQTCTTLVEEDSQFLLTVTVGVPSIAVEGGYHFFVPGVDGAELEVDVP
ncbi:MAG: hypothetical protein ACR2O6_01890 [Ilumatobacteraceae bacterium]